ncbi:MAG: hypothetical protein C4290_13510 [Chloroflexota bacterium]
MNGAPASGNAALAVVGWGTARRPERGGGKRRLVERGGERAGTVHVLRPPITTIGRGGENDIVVASTLVSRRHAQITWDGTQYVLTDLGSTNGTF